MSSRSGMASIRARGRYRRVWNGRLARDDAAGRVKARPSAPARWTRRLRRILRAERRRGIGTLLKERLGRFGAFWDQRGRHRGSQRRESDRFRPDAAGIDALDMRRSITLRIRRGATYFDKGNFPRVELDGEMGAAGKRARHQLEHEHESAGGSQNAAPPIPRCAERRHCLRIARALGAGQWRASVLALC